MKSKVCCSKLNKIISKNKGMIEIICNNGKMQKGKIQGKIKTNTLSGTYFTVVENNSLKQIAFPYCSFSEKDQSMIKKI